VASAKEIERRGGEDGLDEDIERASADKALVVLGVLVEVEVQAPGFLLAHHVLGHGPDLGLDAAAAYRAQDRAVVADENLRALIARDRALHLNDGGQRRPAPLFSEPGNLGVDIHSVQR